MIIKDFLLPLVYLGNGHYSGQTPPPPADNSLTSGETILVVIFMAR